MLSPIVRITNRDYSLQEATTTPVTLQEATTTPVTLQEVTSSEQRNVPAQSKDSKSFTSLPEPTPSQSSVSDDNTRSIPETVNARDTVDKLETLEHNRYYYCLSPGENEVIFLHHDDIVNRECNVVLTKLTEEDINHHMSKCEEESRNIAATENSSDANSSSDSSVGGTKSDPEWNKRTKTKRPFKYRPRKGPSKARIAAQKVIEENNKRKRRRKIALPMKILKDPELPPNIGLAQQSKDVSRTETFPMPVKKADLPEATNAPDDNSTSSDETIIYEPPKNPVKKYFSTKTCGIKKTKKIRTYKCPGCGIRKTSLLSLNDHYRRHHKRVKCSICGKIFNTPSSRNKHMYMHKSKERYQCEHCEKDFPFKSMLNDHRGKHIKGGRYPCWWPNCRKGFSFKGDLKKHIIAHKNAKKPKKCEYCDYENADMRNVKQHQRVHTNEKPHKCKYCGKGYRFWVQKKRHIDNECKKNPYCKQ